MTLHQLDVRGHSTSVADVGQGPPVLWLHGFPLDGRLWVHQAPALEGKFRSLIPDLPGCGRSTPIRADFPAILTMDDLADWAAGILDALAVTEPVVLAGLSMGGYIAWACCRKYPERLRGLILCDTLAAADPPEGAALRLVNADRILREGAGPFVEEMLPRLLGKTSAAQRPDLIEAVRSMAAAAAPQALAAVLRGMAARPDSAATAAAVAVPSLVICGEEDAISTPARMAAFAATMPDCRLVEIPAAGHLAPLEQPAAVNAALREFLERFA